MPAIRIARWILASAVIAVAGFYVGTVAVRAHFQSPPPTPIVYDRNGAFLAQFGDVEDGRTEYGYWHADALPTRVVRGDAGAGG